MLGRCSRCVAKDATLLQAAALQVRRVARSRLPYDSGRAGKFCRQCARCICRCTRTQANFERADGVAVRRHAYDCRGQYCHAIGHAIYRDCPASKRCLDQPGIYLVGSAVGGLRADLGPPFGQARPQGDDGAGYGRVYRFDRNVRDSPVVWIEGIDPGDMDLAVVCCRTQFLRRLWFCRPASRASICCLPHCAVGKNAGAIPDRIQFRPRDGHRPCPCPLIRIARGWPDRAIYCIYRSRCGDFDSAAHIPAQ